MRAALARGPAQHTPGAAKHSAGCGAAQAARGQRLTNWIMLGCRSRFMIPTSALNSSNTCRLGEGLGGSVGGCVRAQAGEKRHRAALVGCVAV